MKQKIIIFVIAAIIAFTGLILFQPWQDAETASDQHSGNQAALEPDTSAAPHKAKDSDANDLSNESAKTPIKTVDVKASSSNRLVESAIRDKQSYPVRVYRPLQLPNDPLVNQWWVGQTKLADVWATPRPAVETTLAIIDTGFALDHEEFSGRWHKNPGETGPATSEAPSKLNCTDQSLSLNAGCNLIDDDRDGIVDNETGTASYENPSRLNCTDQGRPLTKDCNLIDDDGNGLVDDYTGWDFMNFDNSVQAGELNPHGTGTTHGTLVAGLAAATGGNAKGIAGVDWSTKILPIQALDDDSYGDTFSVGDAIYYAIEQQADVISISLGSDYPDDYVLGAVRAALAEGIAVVAASGNTDCDCMVYPARYPEVVAVGAADSSSQPASFSSWGSSLYILAPGVNMTTTTWSADNQTSAYASGVNGTSFATPIVAGVFSRMLAQQPSATPQQLAAAVTENSNRTGLSAGSPHSTRHGFGLLDASKSNRRLVEPYSPALMHAFTPVYNGNFLQPGNNLEKGVGHRAYKCSDGTVGSSPVYNIKKSSSDVFTLSQTENQLAMNQGYSSSLFAYTCLQMPHDQPQTIRQLNIYSEFKNISQSKY